MINYLILKNDYDNLLRLMFLCYGCLGFEVLEKWYKSICIKINLLIIVVYDIFIILLVMFVVI